MTTYKAVVELPAIEFNALNWMMNEKIEPMTFEHLLMVQADCKVSWAWQNFTDEDDYLDRVISAEFENGMIMDVYFYCEVGEAQGYYYGIQFGDKNDIFVYPNEYTKNCYSIAEGNEGMVDGIYAMYYNGDVYEMEIKAAE